MLLERWDAIRCKWIMYQNQDEHSADCKRYPYDQIPARVFLDTSVVNLIVKYAPAIFEMAPPYASTPLNRVRDIEALMHVFAVGARANWSLRASAKTLSEVNQTSCDHLRAELAAYVRELLMLVSEDSRFGDDFGRRVADSALLAALPDRSDRELLGNAIGLECDAFITADVRTIVSKRGQLPDLPLRVLTPTEWWSHVKPWGGLWL